MDNTTEGERKKLEYIESYIQSGDIIVLENRVSGGKLAVKRKKPQQ